MIIHRLRISCRCKKDENLANHSLLTCLRSYKAFFNLQICPSSIEVNLGGTTMYTSSFNFPCKKTFFMSNCFKIIEARERRNLIVVIFAIGEKVSCSQCPLFVCIPLSLILFYIFQQSNVLLLFIPM